MEDVVARVSGHPLPGGPTLDLRVRRGEAVWLRGPNGSGKTSLLRALAGLSPPVRPREVEVRGENPARLPAARLRLHRAHVPEEARDGLVGLTVEGEFRLRGVPRPSTWPTPPGQESRTLSSGEARRLGLALVDGAPLLLLDEPLDGLDAAGRTVVRALMREGRRRGAVVYTDHAGHLADEADRIIDLGPEDPLGAWPRRAPAQGPVLVEASATRVRLGDRWVPLPGVALPTGFHVVTGPNGAGKSTLLRRLAGLAGDGVRLRGRPPAPGDVRLLLPQARSLFTEATVAAEVGGAPGTPLVPRALMGRHPLALSRGEAQRVALAKVFRDAAPLVLLDEPESHLDAAGRALLADAVFGAVARGACVLAATHDPVLVAAADRVVALEGP